jgi:arginase
VAIHFDVDTIDAEETQLGLGADLGGLTAEARRVVADIDGAAEVVALTIAEFIPRQVIHLQQLLAGWWRPSVPVNGGGLLDHVG